MGILLDIITITKDDLKGVASTIESTRPLRNSSVARQIIIDGGSTQVRYQVEELIKHEKNVTYNWQASSGISAAFNQGLLLSESQWVWFLNGGDTFHPSVDCRTLLNILQASTADAILFQIEANISHTVSKHAPLWKTWPPIGGYTNWIPHPSAIIKRQLFDTHGHFNTEYKIAMDYELWLRLFSKNTIVDTISIPLTMFDETGISSNQARNAAQEAVKIIWSNMPMLFKKWLYNGIMICKSLRYYYKQSRNSR